MNAPIYFDYLSTTPVDPRVAEAMGRCLTMDGTFGNPHRARTATAGRRRWPWRARAQQVAGLIGADLREIVWTSGATEADNLAIKGVVDAARPRALPARTCSPRRSSTRRCSTAGGAGGRCGVRDRLAPDADGLVIAQAVDEALRPETCLVSIMHANNEIGTVNDIAAIAAWCRAPGCLLHVDAAQSAGKMPVDVRARRGSYVPVGAQVLRAERHRGAVPCAAVPARRCWADARRRARARLPSGTLPTHQIVGMGWRRRSPARNWRTSPGACARCATRCGRELAQIDGVTLNGHRESARLPGALNISVAGVEGEALLLSLSDFALSTGSACTSASLEPSYVLRALGLPDALAHSSLRISLGRFTARRTWRASSSDCARWYPPCAVKMPPDFSLRCLRAV
jgi:cysteine desulfurase